MTVENKQSQQDNDLVFASLPLDPPVESRALSCDDPDLIRYLGSTWTEFLPLVRNSKIIWPARPPVSSSQQKPSCRLQILQQPTWILQPTPAMELKPTNVKPGFTISAAQEMAVLLPHVLSRTEIKHECHDK